MAMNLFPTILNNFHGKKPFNTVGNFINGWTTAEACATFRRRLFQEKLLKIFSEVHRRPLPEHTNNRGRSVLYLTPALKKK